MWKTLPIFYVPLLGMFAVVSCIDQSQCIAPLGMENGMIKDRDITASSSFDHGNVGPHHGRVRNDLNGGAWCPQIPATSEAKEWIEIDFHTVHLVTATEIQGRFGNGRGVEFAESYMIEYYRPRLNKWMRYRTRSNSDLLKGNVNTYLEEKTSLDPPLWASKIRFYPYSSYKRTVCMRVEVYGCRWTDGIVSYTMPQGDRRGNSWEFYDFTYDGHWDGEKLKYGLGQLVDGQVAPEDFKMSFNDENLQGWIGWKNDTRDNKPIEIVFEFDRIREFTALNIYANNQFTRDVQVFSFAKIAFSIGGHIYKGEPITYEHIEDRIFETPRNVSIKLHHRVGRFVKLQLHFAARWMLISEVNFESFPLSGNFTLEEEEDNELLTAEQKPNESLQDNYKDVNKKNVISVVDSSGGLGQYLGIVVGILVVVVIFMLATVMYVMIQQRRYKGTQRPGQGPDKAMLYRTPSFSHLTNNSEYADIKDPEYAVPLQLTTPSRNFFPKPLSSPNPSEHYYAETEVCKPQFTPLSPPLCTPPPVRLQRQPRYVNDRAYIGS